MLSSSSLHTHTHTHALEHTHAQDRDIYTRESDFSTQGLWLKRSRSVNTGEELEGCPSHSSEPKMTTHLGTQLLPVSQL